MKKKVLAIVAAAALAAMLGLTACGGSSSSSAASGSASASSASPSASASSAEASSSAASESASTAAASSSAAASEWEVSAFTGTTDDGKYLVYYVDMSDSATQQAFATLLFEDASTHEAKQITGDVSIDADGAVVINDVETSKPFHFMPAAPNEDDSIPVAFEDYGTATVVVADPATVRDTIDKVMDEAQAK